ncbi:MAG: hypothetical protein Q9M20_08370 [Mariprofundaceae bacterium]|nr:hypothetical protein [Mariprofundaceae bacterium]
MQKQPNPSGSIDPLEQLEAIKAMLSSGHQSIRIEKHTFYYWGIAGGLLSAVLPLIYAQVGNVWINLAVFVSVCGSVLGLVAFLDHRKTRKIRRSQDESVSFIQTKITHIWWLLIAVAIVLTTGLAIYGGGAIDIAVWLLLMGLALIIHGFFSTQPLMRFGVALIAISIVSPFLLPYGGLRWLAVSVFGIGIPLLGFMLYQKSGFWNAKKPKALVVWLALAILPGYGLYMAEQAPQLQAPEVTPVSLADYQQQPTLQQGSQIVQIPAGTRLPIKLSAKGDIISDSAFIELPITLKNTIEVVLENGKLNGLYRIDQGKWQKLRAWRLISINDLFIDLNPQSGLNMDVQLRIYADKQ